MYAHAFHIYNMHIICNNIYIYNMNSNLQNYTNWRLHVLSLKIDYKHTLKICDLNYDNG